MTSINELLEKFPDVRVLVCGDVMLDRYLFGNVARISPEAPVPVLNLESERSVVGGAANVAANIAGLGASVQLISAVGDDPEAVELKELLSFRGIDPVGVATSTRRVTTVKSRILAGSHQIARVDRESVLELDDEEANLLFDRFEKLTDDLDVVVISDYGKGIVSPSFVARLILSARKAGIAVLVDPKGLDYKKYRGATLLTPNQKEAHEIHHAETRTNGSVRDAGEYILKAFEIDELVVTLGADGMALFSSNAEPTSIPASARKVFDVTGAGDTVIAAMAVAIGAGANLITAATIANIAAGEVIEKVGTTAIDFESLRSGLLEFEAEEAQAV